MAPADPALAKRAHRPHRQAPPCCALTRTELLILGGLLHAALAAPRGAERGVRISCAADCRGVRTRFFARRMVSAHPRAHRFADATALGHVVLRPVDARDDDTETLLALCIEHRDVHYDCFIPATDAVELQRALVALE